jgi:hypothetical protein
MKSTLIQMSEVIKRAAETKAAVLKLKAAQQMDFVSRNLSIITVAGITIILLVIVNLGNI